LLKNAQRLLQPVKVINPFAKQLKLPQSVFKPRRTNAHYLHFIEAITFLHQQQREKQVNQETGEEFIQTTLEDIEAANGLLKDILLKKSDRLTPACRSYFEQLKNHLKHTGKEQFTNQEISLHLKKSLTTIKRNHYALVDDGYLKTVTKKGSRTLYYEVTSFEEYHELQASIDTALDKALDGVKKIVKAQSPTKAQNKNGLTKPVKSAS